MAIVSPRQTAKQPYQVPLDQEDERLHRYILARGLQVAAEQLSRLPVGVSSVTTTYTMDDLDSVVLADASGGAFTVTLISAQGRKGRKATVKKTDATPNIVTVDGAGTETIDGATSVTLETQHHAKTLVSDNANWHLIGEV